MKHYCKAKGQTEKDVDENNPLGLMKLVEKTHTGNGVTLKYVCQDCGMELAEVHFKDRKQ